MPEEVFKIPTSAYEAITKIIRAYATLGQPSTPEQVGKLAGQSPDRVTKNNGFLVSIGVIEGGKKKKITDTGVALSRALDHEMPDEITRHWRSIVLSTPFLEKLIAAVRIRKGMDPATLQSHVAYSAGRPKTSDVMTGAAAVVDILRASGLITAEDSGKLVATGEAAISQISDEPSRSSVAGQGGAQPQPRYAPGLTGDVVSSGIAVNIQIQIQCSAEEVEGLGAKIRAMLKEISRPDRIEFEDDETDELDQGEGSEGDRVGGTTSDPLGEIEASSDSE